jgi:hypothetical protein
VSVALRSSFAFSRAVEEGRRAMRESRRDIERRLDEEGGAAAADTPGTTKPVE